MVQHTAILTTADQIRPYRLRFGHILRHCARKST